MLVHILAHMHHSACVEVRGHLSGVAFLLPLWCLEIRLHACVASALASEWMSQPLYFVTADVGASVSQKASSSVCSG